MRPPFISLTDALSHYKAELARNRSAFMPPAWEQAFDDTFTYGFTTGASTVCRLLLVMNTDPDVVAMIEVFAGEVLAIQTQQGKVKP